MRSTDLKTLVMPLNSVLNVRVAVAAAPLPPIWMATRVFCRRPQEGTEQVECRCSPP